MAADVKTHLYEWSTTEGSNLPVGSTVVSTNLDDNLRMIQKVVRDLSAPTTLAAAGTTDLGSKDETFITLTGTAATITALGTVSAGIYKWVIFNAAHVLTHNGTSLILPSAANITAASGDVACFVSLGSGNWRCVSYTRASGVPLSSASLSGLSAALAANTIANTDYTQTWGWKLTTASKAGFRVTETAASTGAAAVLLNVDTLAASTAYPLEVSAQTSRVISVKEDGEVFLAGAPGQALRLGYLAATGAEVESNATPNGVFIHGQSAGSSGQNGGPVRIYGGDGTDNGGDVAVVGGTGTTDSGGDITITGGAGANGENTDFGGAITITAGAAYASGNIDISIPAPGTVDSLTQGNFTVSVTNDDAETVGFSIQSMIGAIVEFGAAPSITSGAGSGATIVGTRNAFQLTCGTSPGTTIVVELCGFLSRIPNPPLGWVNYRGGTVACRVSASTDTSVTIETASALPNGSVLDVMLYYYS